MVQIHFGSADDRIPGTCMTRKEHYVLERDPEAKLTEEQLKDGWHFCNEWDGMLIHITQPEYEACLCDEYRKTWGNVRESELRKEGRLGSLRHHRGITQRFTNGQLYADPPAELPSHSGEPGEFLDL